MEQCPVCYHTLTVRDCTPCDDCGWNVPKEIEHLDAKSHTYSTYEIYQGLRLTLCNFCDVDFGSYKSDYLGFSNNRRLGYQHFNFIKTIENPQLVKDKFCPACEKRLSFLRFLQTLRQLNETTGQ